MFHNATILRAESKEVHTDWNRAEGNCKQLKGRVGEKWASSQARYSNDDLDVINNQLEGKIGGTVSQMIKSARISMTGTAVKSGTDAPVRSDLGLFLRLIQSQNHPAQRHWAVLNLA